MVVANLKAVLSPQLRHNRHNPAPIASSLPGTRHRSPGLVPRLPSHHCITWQLLALLPRSFSHSAAHGGCCQGLFPRIPTLHIMQISALAPLAPSPGGGTLISLVHHITRPMRLPDQPGKLQENALGFFLEITWLTLALAQAIQANQLKPVIRHPLQPPNWFSLEPQTHAQISPPCVHKHRPLITPQFKLQTAPHLAEMTQSLKGLGVLK